MELAHLRVGTLNTDFSDSEGFGLDSHVMGYPPSSANSFSSDSSFGPYTPTSGRSTPPGSDGMHFDMSFTSSVDPFSFDLTPPSSAMSAYFQIDLKTEDPCGFYQPRLPAIPTRNQLEMAQLPFRTNSNCQTPSQPLGFYPLSNGIESSILPLTPLRTVQGAESCTTWSMWQESSESPKFDKWSYTTLQQPSTAKRKRVGTPVEFRPDSLDYGLGSRRRHFDTAKERAAALHHAQQESPLRERTRPVKKEPNMVMIDGMQVEKISSDRQVCDWPDCAKKFRKKEHLVRHKDCAHRGVYYQCEFCDRKFNRTDNRRSHLKLHANPQKKGRVKYVPEAAKLLEEEERLYKSGKNRKRGASLR
ncbi:hypothetical protein QBC34DRAFT_43550 [Podospora aff. communis PSN243]|uniref:C2H2-type domain-containing protein n=1 Tax=Podospora aff. communis PSN243 TaxID=3040156 RepID=A0AAV9GU67_9PEZI|nr:hypothetical protein QBC34DRAFT_43550 [Podospora aff. communis PSN243]